MIFGARELRRRRIGLVEQCAAQRAAVAASVVPLTARAGAVDRVLTTVRGHPILAALAAGAVGGLLPRFIPPWLTRLWLLYSLLRRFIG
ncbi:MAG TPA: hypothetical protein VKE95_15620 [Burkholderiales bacterium]|nr:hypothetical protein [Burkholderiales bacterium]